MVMSSLGRFLGLLELFVTERVLEGGCTVAFREGREVGVCVGWVKLLFLNDLLLRLFL